LTPYGGSVFEWNTFTEEELQPAGATIDSPGQQPEAERPAYQADERLIAAWSSLSSNTGELGALWRLYKPGHRFVLPVDRPPLWRTVEIIETAPADPTPYVRGDVLLATQDAAQPVVVYRRVGHGELFWVTRPELATNDWLGRADNHRLILALMDYAAQRGPLYVDEHIHGYIKQSPSALWLLFNTTGGHLLLTLAAVIILAFLGAAVRPARFLPQPVPPRRQATEMILAQADLYRRAGRARRGGPQLIDGVKRAVAQVAARHGGAGAPALAELLARLPADSAVSRSDVQLVLDHLEARRAASRQDLLQLARACDAVRRALRSQMR
jgi:hypothetical protein